MQNTTAQPYDVVIIGGGHNGLIAAAYLAKAGKKVVVLEKRPILGGATVTEEIYPGFKYTVFSYVVSLLRPEIIRELELARHGLTMLPLESTFTPMPNDDYLVRWGDHHKTYREIARHSRRDADTYSDYGRLMGHMAKAAKPILGVVPPDIGSLDPRKLHPVDMAQLARHFLGLEEGHLNAFIKLMVMSSADFLDEWFETEALKATMSASGIIGTFLGPRSPGTAYVLLHHYMGEIDGVFRAWGFAKGGTGAVAESIASSAREWGADIRTSAPVSQVIVKNGRSTGVALENGDELYANVVASSLDPRQTFLNLLDETQLPAEFVTAIKKFRYRGSSAKVNLALDGLPNFTSLPGFGPHLRGAISISPSIDYLERAYDDAKYGEFSKRPYIDMIIPSLIDPDMAPPGKHVMSCFVQYAPYHLTNGSWDERRDEFGDTVIDTIAQFAPNIKDIILHRQVMTPLDIERVTGLSEGNIFQGELSLQQLFFLRPAPGWSNYRTPIKGYYQCGSGAHPGGGIMGASGRLGALEILKDWS